MMPESNSPTDGASRIERASLRQVPKSLRNAPVSWPVCMQLHVDQLELEKIEALGQLPALSTPVRFDLSMLPASTVHPDISEEVNGR
jgi:hypothetical protein